MVLPRRLAVAPATAILTLALAACGGTAPGQDGGGNGDPAAPSIAKSYTIKAGDTTAFPLAAGTYRLAWTTTGCTSVNIALNGDNGFTNERASRNPNFARIITSVPDGTYTLTQLETNCADWTATIDKIG